MTRLIALISLVLITGACVTTPAPPDPDSLLALFTGEFVDDYGNRYSIDPEQWVQQPDMRYDLREWHVSEPLVVAQNDAANPRDPGLWTRIDFLLFEDREEYEWAFCYTTYRASSVEEALAATAADRSSPLTGCNGFPFSRMKRVD